MRSSLDVHVVALLIPLAGGHFATDFLHRLFGFRRRPAVEFELLGGHSSISHLMSCPLKSPSRRKYWRKSVWLSNPSAAASSRMQFEVSLHFPSIVTDHVRVISLDRVIVTKVFAL